jgi:hypothetical protein
MKMDLFLRINGKRKLWFTTWPYLILTHNAISVCLHDKCEQVGQVSELKGRLQSHHAGASQDEV